MLTIHILGMDGLVEPWETYIANPEVWPEGEPIPINPYEKVRISWPTGGAPAWKVHDDITFLRIFEVDDAYNRRRDTEKTQLDADNVNLAKSYTRVNAVHWVFYGPNSYDNAQKVRDGLSSPNNRRTLAIQNLFRIIDFKAPIRVPENYMGQWWERTDFTVNFNEHVIVNETSPTIVEVPVTTTLENGDEVTFTIK